ncbi:GAS2-like protein 2A isoform X2 [Rhinichthys klamathensis goyatoka]|uniref:GAS2-like protein 2A isoform X2 n=1 Tax=Rhinichthys klamathensis goyatoka TaxID=3034132 RepID=UPI0024B6121D|nr:GAS2-like protein 2A isoform X2 [Rhinichthys klamathensis goyatoka]
MSGIQHASNQSIKPFKSGEEYLYAMKEDLAEWLGDLYNMGIDVNNILEVLETGALLCAHANNVTRVADEFLKKSGTTEIQLTLPASGVTFVSSAHPTTFLARDNVTNFINWCRKEMSIPDVLMFETDDLVLRKNEKNFVLCLLEVARRASRFGMASPVLIQLEQEIEEEIREEMEDLPAQPKPQRRLINIQDLDEMVQFLISRCTCPSQFPMVKVSEGKYRVGDSYTLIFVRILRNHVMVRVGGGWDTLEHYLDKHDPCRCTSLIHKLTARPATPVHEIKERLTSPRPDAQCASQTTLMLSRTQSPLQPVVWTPSAPYRAQRGRLSPPRSSCSPDPKRQPTRRRNSPSPNKLRERPSTPSREYNCADRKDSLRTNSSSRTGRNATRTSPTPRLTSSLPRATHHPTTPQPEIQRPQTPLVLQRNNNQIQRQQAPEKNLGQTWTKSQFVSKLRQNSTVGVKGRENEDRAHLVSDMKESPGRTFQSFPGNTHSCSKPPNITIHEPEGNGGPKKSAHFIRNFSPFKGITGAITEAQHTRPRTPAKIFQEESPGKPKNILDVTEKGQLQQGADRSASKKVQHLALHVPNIVQFQKSLGGEEGGIETSYLFTPPPLSPSQEAILYKSLEEEILCNLQQLSIDTESSTSSDEKLHETPKNSREIPSDHCKASNRSASLDRATPDSGNRAFDAVMAELSSGQRKMEKVSVEKWMNTLPKGLRGKVVSKPCMTSSWSSLGSSMDSKETAELVKVPVDNSNVETKIPPVKVSNLGTEHVKKQRSCSIKQRRSLRKPERVPSIFKLKLKPCVRPRRDHRSDRKPSKIPKPVFYKRTSCKDANSQNQRGNDSPHGPFGTDNSRGNTWAKPKSQVPIPSATKCQRANKEPHGDQDLETWV